MSIIKLLGTEIKKEKKGELSTKFADMAYTVRRMHDVCGDSAFIYEDSNKAILAVLDGVSGEEGAEQASSVAAVAILNHLKRIESPTKEDVQEALITGAANIVYGLTTALVVVLDKKGGFIAGSVGDSVLYSLDKKGILKLEILPMRIVGEGSPVFRFLMFRNMVPSVLGLPADMEIYLKQGTLDPGDMLLLMTDGITDNLKIKIEEKKIKDCSGIDDLKEIIGKESDITKIVKKIRREILRRMEDRVDIKEEEESLIIKPDDLAIIGINLRQKSNVRHSSKQK